MGEGEILNNNEKVFKRYYIYIIHSTERKMGLNVFLCEKRKIFELEQQKKWEGIYMYFFAIVFFSLRRR